ncbi:MAG: hypothetical protein Q4G36_11425 [Paracoccus sp. (in: a-proteobacteria)]|nr:hypothetical protein [Paracoccus sp. (in: a-proteobacteria)]
MREPWNASFDEIRAWAIRDAGWPDQDWDIAISSLLTPQEFALLLTDPAIEAEMRHFLIRCLYIYTGDAVRTRDQASITEIMRFIDASPLTETALAQWAKDARHLIAHPETYRYAIWGGSHRR